MSEKRPSSTFRVSQMDHVEMFVPDRYLAAAWYQDVLGLTVLREYEDWANLLDLFLRSVRPSIGDHDLRSRCCDTVA